ncbi:TadG family pilus assembly protein [Paraburkholderia sp.]|uniref:TadG family pilus assembly protein n=1 Tax=Paraburkholderia sp. TaxID=1926495 RepID=UPI002382EE74|nr:TadG family pilus assembly protein [Paraburkholderia sp.]MDE1184647.1 TadG family pilus assembly protein [Paraburkholderia sp.]
MRNPQQATAPATTATTAATAATAAIRARASLRIRVGAIGPIRERCGRRRQRGVTAIVAALWLGVAVAALGVLDIGNLYLARRDLQSVADLAVLAGIQRIAGSCADATPAATQIAAQNGYVAGQDGAATLTVTCGRFQAPAGSPAGTTPQFVSSTDTPANALKVDVSRSVPIMFIGPSQTVSASATAQVSNIDAFSLSTGLATINTQQAALLNGILSGLLKASVNLSVGSYQGLANANVSLQQLMVALNATTMQGLLATSVTYDQLSAALVSALTAGGDTANASLLGALNVKIPGGQQFTIGDGGTTSPGLLAIGLSNVNSALTATINPLEALLISAQIAQSNWKGNGTSGPIVNVNAGLTGVTGVSLQLLQPPVMAIGEGADAQGHPRTVARVSQVTASVTLAPLPLSGTLIPGFIVQVLNTPIVLSVSSGSGTAELSSVDCDTSDASTIASIKVKPQIASVCIAADAACTQPINILKLGQGLLSVAVTLGPTGKLSVGPSSPTTVQFTAENGGVGSQTVNSNAVGSDVGTLTGSVLAALPTTLNVSVLGGLINTNVLLGLLSPIITPVLTSALNPIFATLDAVLVPLLGALGVQVGTATVNNHALMCGTAQLVN